MYLESSGVTEILQTLGNSVGLGPHLICTQNKTKKLVSEDLKSLGGSLGVFIVSACVS